MSSSVPSTPSVSSLPQTKYITTSSGAVSTWSLLMNDLSSLTQSKDVLVTSIMSSGTGQSPLIGTSSPNAPVTNPYVCFLSAMNIGSLESQYIRSQTGKLTGKYNILLLTNIPKGGPYSFTIPSSANVASTQQNGAYIDAIFNNLYSQTLTQTGQPITSKFGSPGGYASQIFNMNDNTVGGETSINLMQSMDGIVYFRNMKFGSTVNITCFGNSLVIILENSPCTLNITMGPVCQTPAPCPVVTCQELPPLCLTSPNSSNYIFYIIMILCFMCLLSCCAKIIFFGNKNSNN